MLEVIVEVIVEAIVEVTVEVVVGYKVKADFLMRELFSCLQ